jgi:hypothetical protein
MRYHVALLFVRVARSRASLDRSTRRQSSGLELGSAASPSRHSRGSLRSPKFLGEPAVNMPCSCRPRPGDSQSVVWESLLPSTRTEGVGLTAISGISGLDHTACSLAVYASHRGSPRATQDSLPAGHHPLLDRVRTCWLSLKGFRFLRRVDRYVILFPLSEASWHTGSRPVQPRVERSR